MKERKLLMIPGPIEFEPAVMRVMGSPTTSHVAPDFIESFGNALDLMKKVLLDVGFKEVKKWKRWKGEIALVGELDSRDGLILEAKK